MPNPCELSPNAHQDIGKQAAGSQGLHCKCLGSLASQGSILSVWILTLGITIALPHIAFGQSGASESDRVDAEVAQLVAQLDSTKFSEREQAMSALVKLGDQALAGLMEVNATSMEQELRLKRIIARLEVAKFERLSKQFLAEDAVPDTELPGWSLYESIAGGTRTSKLMYLEMLRAQPALMELIESSTQEKSGGKQYALLTVESDLLAAQLQDNRMSLLQVPEIGDVLAMLLATSQMKDQAPVTVNEFLATSANSIPVSQYRRRRGYRNVINRLYECWLPKSHPALAMSVLYLSLRDGLEPGVEVARRHVSANFDRRLREVAIQCISRFGGKEDLVLLLPLLDDKLVCREYFPPTSRRRFPPSDIEESDESPPGAQPADGQSRPDLRVQARICDLALAACIMLADENPETVFPAFREHEFFGFDTQSLALINHPEVLEQRALDIEKWKSRTKALLDTDQ